jgi:ribose transport system ATP-binding protein
MQTESLVQMKNIYKSFGGVKALDNVDFTAKAGEVHALMGENGAGKSTLMKILSGAYSKDEGEIYIEGKKANIINPKSGHEHGVTVIYQEFALAPHLTVAENIYIEKIGAQSTFVDWKKIGNDAKELLSRIGFDNIDVYKPVSELPVAYQQVVEICKALSRESKILVLDEPTAVLTSHEVEQLFKLIRGLKEKGVCIIYVSHRLEEIFEICDRITVLKDGKNVDTVYVKDIDEDKLVTMMVGRSMDEFFPSRNANIGDEVLRVENINRGNVVKNLSLNVRAGEVLGLSGLVGAGRTEAMRLVFGADKKDSGIIFLNSQVVKINSPKQAVEHGIGMLPEDRKRHGVLLSMPIKINATLSTIKKFTTSMGWLKINEEIDAVEKFCKKLAVKMASINNNVSDLSGGNQQKVALLKWLISDCKVLILDEPTRGVDVGAKVEIYKVINQLAESGIAVIMISSEMTEIIGMSDRVIVMREGRVMGELSKNEISEYNIIKFAMGVSKNE